MQTYDNNLINDPITSNFKLKKFLKGANSFENWEFSDASFKIFYFLQRLNDSVRSSFKSQQESASISPIILKLISAFQILNQIIDETPPISEIKFSNPSFRIFLEKIKSCIHEIMDPITNDEETAEYFLISFGSWSRLDFGTGNEINFLAFLTCLDSFHYFKEADYQHIVFYVFWNYWEVIKRIQMNYHLPPAGSLGAWGFDDFVFLPFLFGSSQLINNQSNIHPDNLFDESTTISNNSHNSFSFWLEFLSCYKGNISEHSPTLFSLRSIPSFQEMNTLLLKFFKERILNKPVIIEQYYFGKILSLNPHLKK